MSWDGTLTALRDILANLYETESRSREIVEMSGVPSGRIEFSAAATSNWHNILREAHKHGSVWVIVAIAQREYPNNEELARAGRAYLDRRHRAESAAEGQELRLSAEDRPRIEAKIKADLDVLLRRHTLFGGRESELDRLDAFVGQDSSGYFFLTGPSGFGKTALLANWVQGPGQSNRHVCYHFINRIEGMAGEDTTLRSLCQQLTAYHDLRGELPASVAELRALYRLLLAIPPDEGERLVVVMDGLDEGTHWTPGLHLLFPHEVPEGVFVIFSARTVADVDWLELLELSAPPVEVLELGTMGVREIANLLHKAGGAAEKLADDTAFVAAAHRVSQGDPFYLNSLVQDILQNKITAANIDQQPEGLDRYLGRWWQEVSEAATNQAVQDLLGYLLVAKGPLPRDCLIDISTDDALNSWVFDPTHRKVERYVVGDRENGYLLNHPRFQDYLARVQIREADQRPYRQNLLGYCARWPEHKHAYALRYYAQHLAEAAQAHDEPDPHGRIKDLVTLVSDETFQATHLDRLQDPVALVGDFLLALTCAAGDEPSSALTLVVEAALALVSFRRDRLAPQQVFALARMGEVVAALQHLALFSTEREWRQASSLLIAWHAAEPNHEEARALFEKVSAQPLPAGILEDLRDCVGAVLAGENWPEQPLPDVSRDEVDDLIRRLGGMRGAEGLQAQESYRMAMEVQPSEGRSSYESSLMVTGNVSLGLVAYAAHHPEEGRDYVEEHLAILAANSYVRYRNRFLWPVLGAALMHPDPAWAQNVSTQVADVALAPSALEFQEGLPITVWALQARADGDTAQAAWEHLEGYRTKVQGVAETLKPKTGPGDSWGSYTRRLAALAQAYHFLGQDAVAQELLVQAKDLHYGFAGFQAPAWLTLAEASALCGAVWAVPDLLDAARISAHNIQEPTFCAQTTARYNALAERWWGAGLAGIDIADVVRDLAAHPESARYAALHRIGEAYAGREGPPLPSWATAANTWEALAELYGQPVTEFQWLNPFLLALEPGTGISVPDPEMAPLLAARLAVEVLLHPGLSAEDRAELVQLLVPLAAPNPTALDTVLARLLLAAPPPDGEIMDRLAKLVEKLPLTPVEKGRRLAEGY